MRPSVRRDDTGQTAGVLLALSNSFSFSGVPAGTYNLSVSAANACGVGASTSIQTITIP